MKIAILTTDRQHPVVPQLEQWADDMRSQGHALSLCFDRSELTGGDVLFLVSCGQIIGEHERQKFQAVLVLHASDLPEGRGWSPHIWSILGGATRIPVCLLEACDQVDTGPIWAKTSFELEGHELLREINEKLFAAELYLMKLAVERFHELLPAPQSEAAGSYWPRRTPEDSRLDPSRSLAEQFELLRVVDNARYPAFFDLRGKRYTLRIEKGGDAG